MTHEGAPRQVVLFIETLLAARRFHRNVQECSLSATALRQAEASRRSAWLVSSVALRAL
jgi:hypothetical protein